MDSKTIDKLISTRGLVKINDRNGWAAGVIGIALGFRPLYGNMKVGFVDDKGEYTGEYTMVPLSMVEEVTAPVQPEPNVCGIRAGRSVERNTSRENIVCPRPKGHGGLHRDTVMFISRRVQWGDNECWQEPAEPVFTVKLWYSTGAFEAPTGPESLCRTVFEEALSNNRVIAAELHDARGIMLEAFGRTA